MKSNCLISISIFSCACVFLQEIIFFQPASHQSWAFRFFKTILKLPWQSAFMELGAFARLTRIEHGFMLALAAAIGIIVAQGSVPSLSFLFLAALPPFFIELASFSLNDLLDVKSDRINKRTDRPLVSGDASRNEALDIAVVGFAAGNAIAYLISWPAFAISLVFSLLAIAYNVKLKDLAVLGNFYIALTMAIPFAYGSIIAAGAITNDAAILASIAFVVGLAREIMKTVQDVEGDRRGRNAKTLPMLIGIHNSLYLASFLYLFAIVLSYFPYASAASAYHNNLAYALPVAITGALLLYVAYGCALRGRLFLKQGRSISLLALGIGLLGFLAGAVY
jgi:geranylgeranylglycerol-phosphate geranylgeranyltransferase